MIHHEIYSPEEVQELLAKAKKKIDENFVKWQEQTQEKFDQRRKEIEKRIETRRALKKELDNYRKEINSKQHEFKKSLKLGIAEKDIQHSYNDLTLIKNTITKKRKQLAVK